MTIPDRITSADELAALIPRLVFPVVIKTAQQGIHHKSDVGGVRLDIQTPEELRLAYQDLDANLGADAIVATMISNPGIEMILGLTRDDHFGPVVVLGFGGNQAELFDDVVMMLPPFDARTAMRALKKLEHGHVFAGHRTLPSVDLGAFCDSAAIFSVMATQFADLLLEVDINPMKILEHGCIGLDALVIRNDAKQMNKREPNDPF